MVVRAGFLRTALVLCLLDSELSLLFMVLLLLLPIAEILQWDSGWILDSGSEQVGSASALQLFAWVNTLVLLLIPHPEFPDMRSGFV